MPQKWIISFALAIGLLASLSGCAPLVIAGAGAAIVGVNTANSNLTVSEQVDDNKLKIDAVHALKKFPDLERNSNVEITVFNGIILTLGQVPTQKLKTDIGQTMSALKGSRIVYNQLTVGKEVGFGQFMHDTWLTTKVKSRMLGEVNASHFKVITEKGVVYLLALTTKEEGHKAALIASQTPGVKQVVKAYAYMTPPPLPKENATDEVAHTTQTDTFNETEDMP